MKALKLFGFLVICTAIVVVFVPRVVLAQAQGMTYEEYTVKLTGHQQRAADAKQALAECRQASEGLSVQITDLDAQIAAAQNEIFGLVGSDETGVETFLNESDQMEARLMGLLSLGEDALFDQREEIYALEERLEEMQGEKRSLLPDAQTKLKNIQQLLERLGSRLPAKRIRQYTVVRGDCLWNIAKKPDIYNDPYLWPRIYVENRTKVKDPDLIYPDWVLSVPFGVDRGQHLVVRGQHLSMIADLLYKDVTKWHKIYQANKNQILDPSLVFPAQVLDIPAN